MATKIAINGFGRIGHQLMKAVYLAISAGQMASFLKPQPGPDHHPFRSKPCPSCPHVSPLNFYKTFISFAFVDEPFPTQLYGDLTKAKVSCWKVDESAVLGRGLWANIDRAIGNYDKVIVVCSENSLQSPAVLREIERALQKEDDLRRQKLTNPNVDADVLFPVRIDDYIFEGWKHERKADVVNKVVGDFRGWKDDPKKYQREFDRLLKALDPRSW